MDFTLPEIVRITGRPRSSVHYHIRGISLSRNKQKMIREAYATQIRSIALKRRGVSARLFKKFAHWDQDMVCLVSHLIFDGEIKRRGCIYNNRNGALIDRVENCMKAIYPLDPKRHVNTSTGVARISYYNVSLGDYMKTKSVQLLQEIATLPRQLKREFLLSFFDDEGCIDFRPHTNTRRVRGYQKNVDVLKLIQQLLRDFDIRSFVQMPNEIVITYKDNLARFEKEIGFSCGVRINGARSNSIWKKSLEKRELLRRAIASYKPIGSNGVHRQSHGNATSITGTSEL